MALEIRSQLISFSQSFSPFTFSGSVGSYAYGISAFNFSNGSSTRHYTKKMEIFLSANDEGNTVTINYDVTFENGSGSSYYEGLSWIRVTVVAWIGNDAAQNIFLGNVNNISSGSNSPPITLAMQSAGGHIGILSGFTLAFSGSGKRIEKVHSTIGSSVSGLTALLNANLDMANNAGTSASTAIANAGLIVPYKQTSNYEIHSLDTSNSNTYQVKFSKPISNIAVLAVSFNTSFNNFARRLNSFGLNTIYSIDRTGLIGNVTAYASLSNGHGDQSSFTRATVLVIGIYGD